MWVNKNEKTITPEVGEFYWATIVEQDKPIVIKCLYAGPDNWIDTRNYRKKAKIKGWWYEPKPEAMKFWATE